MNSHLPQIAVVSMAGIFPNAPDLAQFQSNILDRVPAIAPVPPYRWAAPLATVLSKARADHAASDKAGLITDFTFDAQGFDLDPDLLASLDPVHHLVLSAGKKALEDCVSDPAIRHRTGIILAAIALPTARASALAEKLLCHTRPYPVHPYEALGATVVSSPAAILARALGCRGGSFTLDAACASSLFAIKLACEQLAAHRADMMVAGGVSRPDSLYTQVGFTQLSALSPTGRCAPFDRDADGLVVGEGTGIVVLKRLEDALACGDHIHGVITGWGVSNDIDGNLVAPASEGQVRAMAAAFQMAGWSLSDIQYLECHGSGTPKGDQVELASILTLASQFGCPGHALSIGSVKSMIGHLLTAAGAAGFIKTLLAMTARMLPPSLNFKALPDQSPARGSGIRVQTEPEPWHPAGPGLPRRAGISAFGFGGINAHLLVEEYTGHASPKPVQPQAPKKTPGPCAIVGMAVLGKELASLADLERRIQGQAPAPAGLPGTRWRNPGLSQTVPGLFMDSLSLDPAQFHIPPNQYRDILSQHLVMLKAAKNALEDAGIRPRPGADEPARTRMGAALGIDFDFGATDFYLRWHHHTQPDPVLDQISPPLSFDRTLGALGGIVASRIAREFKLGGPCFTLSAGTASGIKALETAMFSLDSGETDLFLCGAVDMAGDLCAFQVLQAQQAFDQGILPAEGAAALVLKPLDKAIRDRDRIYAVLRSTGGAGGSALAAEPGARDLLAQEYSLDRALEHGGMSRDALSLFAGDCLPASPNDSPMARHCLNTPGLLGHAGAASGLMAATAAGLYLYRHGLNGPAAVGSLTLDGAAAHAILEPAPLPGLPAINLSGKAQSPGKQPGKQMDLPVAKPQIPEQVLKTLAGLGSLTQEPALEPNREPDLAHSLPDQSTDLLVMAQDATTLAHERFLDLSARNLEEIGRQIAALAKDFSASEPVLPAGQDLPEEGGNRARPVFLNREQCLEYAKGKAGNVLGPAFDIIDTYPVRVRLPAEPLMLVDRILSVQGEMLSMTSGRIVTQHDVLPHAWYLDGGKAPVSISIEAGQADLFLCAWLGIDHVVKGKRKYRLLDARVTFHRPLPRPGETIEYHIEIDRFLRQGEIYLFFFHYKGYINGLPFISMREGCAGFFTEAEVENSGGIILKKEDLQKMAPARRLPPLVPMESCALADVQVDALRQGDLETAFGPVFKGICLGQHQRLPGGPMTLIHRVLALEPAGGRFGLGRIVAEADIHPDDWFLTCHFVDDMVMPGTLMYECCAHALRIFLQRMGWVSPNPEAHWEVLTDNESDLKCRGPVTPKTRKARYDVEIKEIGYGPEPFVRADAHMFSDTLRIVLYKDMGMKLSGVFGQDLTAFWRDR